MLRYCLFFFVNLGAATCFAVGPSDVAKANQSLWPTKIDSVQSYNMASRAEMLIFLKEYSNLSSAEIKPEFLNIKHVNTESIESWKIRTAKYWFSNFLDAAKDCTDGKTLGCGFKGSNFAELLIYANKFASSLPKEYADWLEMSSIFFKSYIHEQARLAALFPNPTSEILPLSDSEVIGDQFASGEFLLTFDDGPTPKNGDTEKYTELLRKENISAFFFVLGNALTARLTKTTAAEIGNIYYRQCLDSHGFEHKSHQKWTDWRLSLDQTKVAVKLIDINSKVAFRPPYGQRSIELIAKQKMDSGSPVVLWNIDSQDWHSKINANEVGDRVQKLMLIWRRGIILFHDVHSKALTAVPKLITFAKSSHLKWVDCHSVK